MQVWCSLLVAQFIVLKLTSVGIHKNKISLPCFCLFYAQRINCSFAWGRTSGKWTSVMYFSAKYESRVIHINWDWEPVSIYPLKLVREQPSKSKIYCLLHFVFVSRRSLGIDMWGWREGISEEKLKMNQPTKRFYNRGKKGSLKVNLQKWKLVLKEPFQKDICFVLLFNWENRKKE